MTLPSFLFDAHRTFPPTAATRILNYVHFLFGFEYSVEFRRTQKHIDFEFENFHEKQHDGSCQLQQLEVMTVNKEELVREYLQGDSKCYRAYEGR